MVVRSENVTFKYVDPVITDVRTGVDKAEPMAIVEIRRPDGNVAAFPATDRNPESGERYCDIYAGKYTAFVNGNPDPDRVAQLNSEIAERQAELEATRKPTPKEAAAQAKADKEDAAAEAAAEKKAEAAEKRRDR